MTDGVACIACGHTISKEDFDKEKCVSCGFSLLIGGMKDRIEQAKTIIEFNEIWSKEKQRSQESV